MPIIKEVKKDACTYGNHKEPLPPLDKYGLGTVWECQYCGQRATLVDDRDGRCWQWHYSGAKQ